MSSSSKDIFIPMFSGKHFDHWSVKMKTVLISEGLWEYVEEGYEAPNPTLMLTAEQKQQFGENRRNDGKALSIIQRGVSSKYFRKILNAKTAKEAWDILHKDLQVTFKMDASTTVAQKVDNAPRPEPMLSSSSTSLTEHGIIPLVEKPLNDLLHSKSNIEPPYPLMDVSTTAAQKVDNAPRLEPMLNSSSTSLTEHGIIPLVEKPLNDLLHSKSNIEPPYPLMDVSTTAAQKVDNAPRAEPMLNSSLIEHGIIPLVEKPLNDLLHTKSNIEPPYPLKVEGISKPQPMLSSPDITHLDEERITPLLELPFYDLMLSKAQVGPTYQMSFPPRLDSALPSITVPAVIKCFGKTWELKFCGDMTPKGFDSSWRKFVDDNNLVVDDAVIFELLESSSVKVMFKVQFLRCEIPPELQESINKKRAERSAITIDDK